MVKDRNIVGWSHQKSRLQFFMKPFHYLHTNSALTANNQMNSTLQVQLSLHQLPLQQQIAKLDGLHLMGNVTSTFQRRKLGRRHRIFAELTRLDNFDFISVFYDLSVRLNWSPFIQPRKTTLQAGCPPHLDCGQAVRETVAIVLFTGLTELPGTLRPGSQTIQAKTG